MEFLEKFQRLDGVRVDYNNQYSKLLQEYSRELETVSFFFQCELIFVFGLLLEKKSNNLKGEKVVREEQNRADIVSQFATDQWSHCMGETIVQTHKQPDKKVVQKAGDTQIG